MKTFNRANKSSMHVLTTLAASIVAVSGLAMGTAFADSNPMPLPQPVTQPSSLLSDSNPMPLPQPVTQPSSDSNPMPLPQPVTQPNSLAS